MVRQHWWASKASLAAHQEHLGKELLVRRRSTESFTSLNIAFFSNVSISIWKCFNNYFLSLRRGFTKKMLMWRTVKKTNREILFTFSSCGFRLKVKLTLSLNIFLIFFLFSKITQGLYKLLGRNVYKAHTIAIVGSAGCQSRSMTACFGPSRIFTRGPPWSHICNMCSHLFAEVPNIHWPLPLKHGVFPYFFSMESESSQ